MVPAKESSEDVKYLLSELAAYREALEKIAKEQPSLRTMKNGIIIEPNWCKIAKEALLRAK